jgi:antitoxin component of MazEF toxin-antitoxin module
MTSTSVKKLGNKLCLELPDSITNQFNISENDHIQFSIAKNSIVISKSINTEIPEIVLSALSTLLKSDNEKIAQWLNTPKPTLNNKAPMELISTDKGIDKVLDLIEQIQTGDFS